MTHIILVFFLPKDYLQATRALISRLRGGQRKARHSSLPHTISGPHGR